MCAYPHTRTGYVHVFHVLGRRKDRGGVTDAPAEKDTPTGNQLLVPTMLAQFLGIQEKFLGYSFAIQS